MPESLRSAAVPGPPIRVLLLGWTNTPHVLGWAARVVALGHEVHLAGRAAEAWPALPVPEGVASAVTFELHGPPGMRGLRLSRDIGRAARRVQPELVHAHWLPEFGWIAARERLAPLICSAWGSDVLGAGGLVRLRSRRAIAAADLVLADSRPLADAARALGRGDTRVEVAHWGVDLDRFRPGDGAAARAALGWPDVPTVLSTRALAPHYRPDVLIAAFACVRERVPNARLVLKHPERQAPPAVLEAIAGSGVGDAVSIIGHVDETSLPELFRAADVAVSIPYSDSSPRSAWEALACGVPLVVSDLPWARDELAACSAAILVPATADAVAAALTRVLTEPTVADALATAGRALAERDMDSAAQSARIDQLYRDVLRPGGCAQPG